MPAYPCHVPKLSILFCVHGAFSNRHAIFVMGGLPQKSAGRTRGGKNNNPGQDDPKEDEDKEVEIEDEEGMTRTLRWCFELRWF